MLSRVKLIAEPWDIGLGGYQVGNFPPPFAEWNGKFRDAMRRYWKGDENLASEIGYRLTGSADLFQGDRRAAAGQHQLHHRARRLHAARSGQLRQQAQRGQRRAQPGRRRRQPVVEPRRRGRDRRSRASSRCASGRSATCWRRCSCRRACRCCWAATRWDAPSAATTTPTARTTSSPGSTGTLDDRRRSLLDFTRRLIALRQRHPVLQRRRFFDGRLHLGVATSKDLAWLRPDGEEMSPRTGRSPGSRRWAFMLGGDAIRMVDERGQRLVDDGLLVLLNAHHEPITFKLPSEDGTRDWLLEFDTADPAQAGRHALRRRVRGGGAFARRCCASRCDAKAAARGGDRARARREEAGPAAPPPRRRADPAVLDPLAVGLGRRRDRATWRAFAGWAASAGFSVVQLLPVQRRWRAPTPARTRGLGLRAGSGLPVAGRVRGLRRRRRAARRCRPTLQEELAGRGCRARGRLGHGARREARGDRARLRALPARRVEQGHGTRAAAGGVHATRIATWLDDYALFRAWHDQYGKSWLDWPAAARDRDPGAIAACAPAAPRRDPAREVDAVAARSAVAPRAARRQRRGRRPDGRSAVRGGRSIRPTSGPTAACSASTATSARRPTRARPTDRTGDCRSTTGTRWRATTSPGSRRARSAPASCSASIASTTRSASTGPTFAAPTAETQRLFAARRSRRRCVSARA